MRWMHHRYFVLRSTNAHARANIYITILLGAFTLFCGFGESCFGNISIGGTPVVFATVQEGQRILATRDDFVQQMGPFDRAARMKTDAEVSEKTFLGFVATNVLEWQDSDKTIVTAALEQLRLRIESLSLPLPKTVYFVKTTGNEEGGQEIAQDQPRRLRGSRGGLRHGRVGFALGEPRFGGPLGRS